METLQYQFEDDGTIPNSIYSLVIYKNAFAEGDGLADEMEEKFAANNWSNAWRNGVFPYHHYHSITHEVLGIYAGNAILHLGGEQGEKLEVKAGDVIVIPAGVGHKKVSASADFAVIGAYPGGMDYDLKTGKEGERPKTDDNLTRVPFPETDPVHGMSGGITEYWK